MMSTFLNYDAKLGYLVLRKSESLYIITKLHESGDLCGKITEFGVAEGSLEPTG